MVPVVLLEISYSIAMKKHWTRCEEGGWHACPARRRKHHTQHKHAESFRALIDWLIEVCYCNSRISPPSTSIWIKGLLSVLFFSFFFLCFGIHHTQACSSYVLVNIFPPSVSPSFPFPHLSLLFLLLQKRINHKRSVALSSPLLIVYMEGHKRVCILSSRLPIKSVMF